MFLDLAAYSIVAENNAAQYYPDYAYNHPLFTVGMHIYSDSKVSDFFASVTDDQRIGFLNEWNSNRDHREKIYHSCSLCWKKPVAMGIGMRSLSSTEGISAKKISSTWTSVVMIL